jgi:acyl dehydratase
MTLNLGAVGSKVGPFEHTYAWSDTALYAVALGAGPEQLDFLLEPSPKVLPTWSVIPAFKPIFAALELTGLDFAKLLHTAQKTEQLAPLPAQGTVETTATVVGIWDMRVGALVQIDSESSIGGTVYARTAWSMLVSGVGSFESARPPASLRTRAPKDVAPSFSERWATQPNQALLYRLTGDINPIHARPEAARAAGLEQPILHGLCTYGFAARAALHALCADDPARFVSFEARFSKPVLPGQVLVADGYVIAPGEAAVTVKLGDSDELVIANALFRYKV